MKERRTTYRRAFDRPLQLSDDRVMTIALAKDVEEFLQEQLRAGVCSDASELVNEVIRSVREQQQKPFAVTPQLEAWLLESAGQPVTPLTGGDFDDIRARVRSHLKPTAS